MPECHEIRTQPIDLTLNGRNYQVMNSVFPLYINDLKLVIYGQGKYCAFCMKSGTFVVAGQL